MVMVHGQVAVKRKGSDRYMPARVGTALHDGDQLRVGSDAKAKVVCAGLSVQEISANRDIIPCQTSKPARPVLIYLGEKVAGTREVKDANIPIIISPRQGRLLNPYPLLRWMKVEGANRYLISIHGEGLKWEEEIAGKTDRVYPQKAPKLKAGKTYLLTVTANGRSSNDGSAKGLGFEILTSDGVKKVREEEKKIRNLKLDPDTTKFLIAHLYSNYDLFAEAIQQIEQISEASRNAASVRLLGDLYWVIGLARQAEKQYLAIPANSLDEDGQVSVQQALARIYYRAIGNREKTIHYLELALVGAGQLGDEQKKKQIELELAEVTGKKLR